MEVIKRYYDITYSLREYAQLHVHDFSASEALEEFMNSSVVACSSETNMWLKRQDKLPKEVDCSSTVVELLEVAITNATAKGRDRDNVLFWGYKYGAMQTCSYANNMVTFFLRPLLKELHQIIGNDSMFYLIKNLSLFVRNESCYIQITGYPLNEVSLKSKVKEKGHNNGKRSYSVSDRFLTGKVFHSTCKDKKRCFPRDHVMEKTACTPEGARKLIKTIFQKETSKRLVKGLRDSVDIFEMFLRRHKSCPMKVLLDKFCEADGTLSESGKVKDVPYPQVKAFCRVVLKRCVPMKLWGSRKNVTAFLSNLERYLSLRKKEGMSIKNVMQGIRINDCDFVKLPKREFQYHTSEAEYKKREGLVTTFYVWLMNSYIVPLLRNAFTITESVPGRNHLFFYRKAVWANAQDEVLQQMHESSKLNPLTVEEAQNLISSGKSLGFAPLRFIPKTSGLRPVINMGAKVNRSKGFSNQLRSVNQLLTHIESALWYEREQFPGLFGGGVMDYGEIFEKLTCFKEKHREDTRPIYFVRLDFTKCYEQMKQDKMLEILEEVLKEDEYNIRKYCQMKTSNKGVVFKHPQVAAPVEDNRYFPAFFKDEARKKKLKNAVVIDKMNYSSVLRDDLMRDLRKHITGNIVKLSSQYYVQNSGIAQGSVISPVLCQIYLGHMERTMFPDILSNEDSLLIRWMDDPLLLTYDLELAKRYLTLMLQDDPVYNCDVNIKKSLVNFKPPIIAGREIARQREDETWIPWCSVLINKVTLEVKYDYSRCEDFKCIKDSLTFDKTKTPCQTMMNNLMAAMQTKLHQVFLDSRINSTRTVEINIQESFTYFARRLDAFVSELPPVLQAHHNPDFFLNGMEEIVQTYYKHASRFLDCTISKVKVFFLFYQAVLELVKQKSVRYGQLIQMVKAKLNCLDV